MSGLGPTGFEKKRLDEIKQSLDNRLRLVFGESLNLDPSTPEAQLNGAIAEDLAVLWEMGESLYNSLNPNTASDNALDLVSSFRNTYRKPATATEVVVDFTGAAGTLVPTDTLFSSPDLPGVPFRLNVAGSVGSQSTLACVEKGANYVGVGKLTEIINPVAGLTGVNNSAEGITGTAIESNEDLRQRSNASIARGSSAIVNALYSSISAITTVTKVLVLENNSDITDSNGIPPHGIWVVVSGGSDADIGQAMMDVKSLGSDMKGSETVNIADIQGDLHEFKFSRPTAIPIHVLIDVQELADWTTDIINAIKAKIVEKADYTIGQDVFASQLYCYLNELDGFATRTIDVDTATPASGNSVTIDVDEVATFDIANITVTNSA